MLGFLRWVLSRKARGLTIMLDRELEEATRVERPTAGISFELLDLPSVLVRLHPDSGAFGDPYYRAFVVCFDGKTAVAKGLDKDTADVRPAMRFREAEALLRKLANRPYSMDRLLIERRKDGRVYWIERDLSKWRTADE